MEWKDIAVVSGKPGMYRVFKPTRSGMILEAIAKRKTKLVINSSYRVSIMQEISLYTTDGEGSVPISEIFYRINDKFALKLDISKETTALTAFMSDILPNYDPKKVYVSDMKKVVSWYRILAEFLPEMLVRKVVEEETKEEQSKEEETKEEQVKAKPKAKAKPKKETKAKAKAKAKPKAKAKKKTAKEDKK